MNQKLQKGMMLQWPLHKIAEYVGYLLVKEAQDVATFGEFNALLTADTIPLDHARELIWDDPFLNSKQKGQVGAVFANTGENTETGRTSTANLAAGAIRAGFGLGGGLVAGHVLGKLFSLPTPVTRALSYTGGIAGALINSGVVK